MQQKRKKAAVSGGGGSPARVTGRRLLLREMTRFPAKNFPGHRPGVRSWGLCHHPDPTKEPLSLELCVEPKVCILPSAPSGSDILHCIFFVTGSQRGGVDGNRVRTQFCPTLLPRLLPVWLESHVGGCLLGGKLLVGDLYRKLKWHRVPFTTPGLHLPVRICIISFQARDTPWQRGQAPFHR